ncbi:RNA methylase [Coprinopsis cinerea okayama7|uniref:tRNA (guanine(10)-N(2))-methyltransferase n=1 Tax=Coprinopsis cinerea (strain Okayama-7 / 130 / ATCC MYA-4618 / FGSC 9003) TaxID=240176 RepID=A8N5A9_COPC7|nr:RNA methylase [Coprinopsis cinerea okayama7\|eukprot:XP_001830054.1 RNA methylase [Coprinopsis cinerea okayama7\
MPQYLFHFAQVHNDFRIPELDSISELYGFSYKLAENSGGHGNDPGRPFMVLELADEAQARLLARRCILVKAVYEYYAQGTTYEQLHAANQLPEAREKWSKYIEDTSFKFIITAYNHTIPQRRQRAVIENFSYMGFLGKIDMKNPEILLTCFEEYDDERRATPRARHEGDGEFRQVYFGKLLEEGSARPLVGVFDVKKRKFYGNTSMEAEVSLLMANQTLASPGKLMYDPFMGTGSMAYPVAHFGSLVFGSDIDGRQMRGKQGMQSEPGVIRAAKQYNVDHRILDLATFDITNHPWRTGGIFDAIITDPPYGVRAGAKRLGRKRELSERQKELCKLHRENPRPDDAPYIPPTKPYELSHLVEDLVLFARYILKPNGRLVFFLPTITDEYEEVDIYTMLCEGMEVIANSLQDFGGWGRRLITIKKTTDKEYGPPAFEQRAETNGEPKHIPAHKDFREKYFQGFKKDRSRSRSGTPEVVLDTPKSS